MKKNEIPENLLTTRKLGLEVKKKSKIFSVSFSLIDFGHLLNHILSVINDESHGHCISITNTESLYHALRIEKHFDYINGADFSLCDGVGVVLAGKILGENIPRLHGPDLMLKCCDFGRSKGWRHFFYGGKEGVPELLSENLTERFPGMITAGTYSPPFRSLTAEEDAVIIKMISESRPDILWVGLGLLKQEQWIANHLHKFHMAWMVGVGAAFDFYAGTIKRAPAFYRKTGLEWLYRLAHEPRMLKRNIYSFMVICRAIIGRVSFKGPG